MTVIIYDTNKKLYIEYSVIEKLPGHTEYNESGTNTWDKFLLEDGLGNNFALLTDRDFVFYLYSMVDGKEELREHGCYNKLKWEGELNEATWL